MGPDVYPYKSITPDEGNDASNSSLPAPVNIF